MPVFLLSDHLTFPPPHLATKEGLLAIGGDLSPKRLLLAYEAGIFPWYSEDDPILWWSPDPRLVLYPKQIKISRSLAKTIRRRKFRITMDTHFEQVIAACARTPRRDALGTWITSAMMEAYCTLHRLGYAHSVETWSGDTLVGGLYGVSLGGCFFGESMFATVSDASKVALVYLGNFLHTHHFDLIDCQIPTEHLASMGALEVSRRTFILQLRKSLQKATIKGPWQAAE
jgi:leucyl/phenylalanyl-tRNA---protein transferase